MSQKWAPTIPKDAARLGDLGKRVFGPKLPKYEGKKLGFSFFGFSGFLDFPDFLVFPLRVGLRLTKRPRQKLKWYNWVAIWSYRALVKAIWHGIFRSFTGAWSQGRVSFRDSSKIGFS